jgi:hypothetical protein
MDSSIYSRCIIVLNVLTFYLSFPKSHSEERLSHGSNINSQRLIPIHHQKTGADYNRNPINADPKSTRLDHTTTHYPSASFK